jgi:hypothetical protein
MIKSRRACPELVEWGRLKVSEDCVAAYFQSSLRDWAPLKSNPGLRPWLSSARLVQISVFHDSMETVQLKSSSSAEWARGLSSQQTQSRRDGTIKSPARKCRVCITNGSSPGRDGTERHSSPSGSSSFDLDPQPVFPSQGCGRSSSNKINPYRVVQSVNLDSSEVQPSLRDSSCIRPFSCTL